MKVLALDLSTKSTGWCIREENKETMLWGFITASSADPINRIHKITEELSEILKNHKDIQKVVLEEVIPKNNSQREEGFRNLHTQKILMWLQASIIFALHDIVPKAEIIYMYPSEWRSKCNISTGRGIKRMALKEADIEFVKRTYNISPKNDDEADAICIGHAAFASDDNEINWG